jgi:hypothetical protein
MVLTSWSLLFRFRESFESHKYAVWANYSDFMFQQVVHLVTTVTERLFCWLTQFLPTLLITIILVWWLPLLWWQHVDNSFALWYVDVNVVLNLTMSSRSERMKYRFWPASRARSQSVDSLPEQVKNMRKWHLRFITMCLDHVGKMMITF